MEEPCFMVPEPFTFNCLKHHAGYIAGFISGFSEPVRGIDKQLLAIGKSQMDIYTGGLTPLQVTGEIGKLVGSRLSSSEKDYIAWLDSSVERYRQLTLSDSSVWILLPGKDKGRHIHIHPGRYSPFSLRVRSETLKTAIAVLVYSRIQGGFCLDLTVINEARVKLLALSPVREVNPRQGLGKMIRILRTAMA